ncbi:MAG: hypothetical protein WCS96_01055 [Victivallales bacterium]
MKKKLFNLLAKAGGDARGQTIVESLMCSMIIMIILVGLLQIFHIGVAKLLTDYSAFRTARSSCVGFADYLLDRSSRVGAIGASGKMLETQNSAEFSSPMAQFAAEEFMIPEYISGNRWLKYEYWFGENTYDAPYYYAYDTTGANPVTPPQTSLLNSHSTTETAVNDSVIFNNYPFPFLDLFDRNRIIFSSIGESIDMTGSSNMTNHALDYLE